MEKYNNDKKTNVINNIIISKGFLFLYLEMSFLTLKMYFSNLRK